VLQKRLVSAPFVTVKTVRTLPLGGDEMSIGTSPKLFASSFRTLPGRTWAVFVAPSAGAVEFLYFAIVGLFSSQSGPAGARKTPVALSYDTSSSALICAGSVPDPLVIAGSLARNVAFARPPGVTLPETMSLRAATEKSAACETAMFATNAIPTASPTILVIAAPWCLPSENPSSFC
jgi:hypothetical protein